MVNRFGFKESDMKFVLEEGDDKSKYPTRANIEAVSQASACMLRGCEGRSVTSFYYLSHMI